MLIRREKKISLLFLFSFFFISLLAQNDTLKAEQFYEEGKDLYYDGNYRKARKSFEKALKLKQKIYGPEHKEVMRVLLRLGKNQRRDREHPSALSYFNQGLEIAQRIDSGGEYEGDFNMELGQVHSQMFRPRKANEYFHKSMEIFKNLFGEESSEVGNIYMDFGMSFIKMANYYDANQNFQKAFDVFQKSSKPTSKDFYRIYNNWGYCYRKMGNFEKGLEFAKKALEIKLMHYDPEDESVSKYHRNIARNLESMGKYEEALPYMKESVRIAELANGKNHENTGGAYGELANLYADMGEYKKALGLYKKGTKILEKTVRPNHPYLIAGYFNLGRLYEDMKDYDEALSFYHYSMVKFQKSPYIPENLLAEAQGRIAEVYFQKGELDSALQILDFAIQTLVPNIDKTVPIEEGIDLDQIQAPVELLDLIERKSELLERVFEQQGGLEQLERAFSNAELAIALIEKMRRSYQSEDARQFLNTQTAPIYERAIEQAYELYEQTGEEQYLIKAFNLSEKSRSSLLWQNLNEQYALTTTAIPATYLDSIDILAQRIGGLEGDLYEEMDKDNRRRMEAEIFDLKFKYELLIKGLEQQNEEYYRLKYAPSTTNIATLKDKIGDNGTALIEYFYSEEHLYIFLIDADGITGSRLPRSSQMKEDIMSLRNSKVLEQAITGKGTQDYILTLNKLYENLIAPVSHRLEEEKNLIIIPFGIQQLLSFEILAPESESFDFRSLNYLLKRFNIQYAWSAALWAKKPGRSKKKPQSYLGFAPVIGDENLQAAATPFYVFRDELSPLPYSQLEVEGGLKYFDGEVFLGDVASESTFLKLAPKSKIIHLATHAFPNGQYPMHSGLVFSTEKDSLEDGFLNTYEIYNLDLNADLAVISACNTGFGEVAEGEGVMSIGRAFLYAGCKSVLMSLWLANDQATSTVLQDFYKYASAGMTKNEALRQAKLDYLESADPLGAHPYFWANLMAVGDMEPLRFNASSFNWKWGIGFVFFGIFFFFCFWNRKG